MTRQRAQYLRRAIPRRQRAQAVRRLAEQAAEIDDAWRALHQMYASVHEVRRPPWWRLFGR